MVESTVLEPGDAIFIPIGYFHTVASAVGLTSEDDLSTAKIGVGINFPVMCEHGKGKMP